MALYQLELDPSARHDHVVLKEKDTNRLERMGGSALGAKWKPLSASQMRTGKGTDLFLLGAPIVTEKAWRTLEPVLGAAVEALPLAITDGSATRFVLNVLASPDCLDRDKSDLWKRSGTEAVYRVKKLVVRGDAVPAAAMFRVAGVEIAPVVVDDRVKDAVAGAKLLGWKFLPVKGGAGAKAPGAKPAKIAAVPAKTPPPRVAGDAALVAGAFKRIEAWAEREGVALGLRKGASDAALAKAEKAVGAPLPAELVASLRLHDGQMENGVAFDVFGTLLSCEGIAREWKIWQGLLERGDLGGGAKPKRGVRGDWWHSRWIPVTTDGSGNHLCVDVAPGPGGTAGQGITVWHDDPARDVEAKGWAGWLGAIADALEKRKLVHRAEDGVLAPPQ